MFGASYRKERDRMRERLDKAHDRLTTVQLILNAQQEQIELLDELISGRIWFDKALADHLGIEFDGTKFVKKSKGVKKNGTVTRSKVRA